MKTATQREDDFRNDFAELLLKHGAEMELNLDNYGMSAHIEITMTTKYNDNNDITEDYAGFNL